MMPAARNENPGNTSNPISLSVFLNLQSNPIAALLAAVSTLSYDIDIVVSPFMLISIAHFVKIAPVRPALMAGNKSVKKRLNRTSPLLSTYTMSFGRKSNSLARTMATGDFASR